MSTFRKIQVQRLSSDFRKATAIVELPFRSVDHHEILIKNHWVGINASDVNFTAGRYLIGVQPPFDAGFESIGQVIECGNEVNNIKPGDYVATTAFGAFTEYQYVKAKYCVPIPSTSNIFLPLLVSGLTASLALEQVGMMKSGEKVLVTAAAGGTGCFAVQLAKLAGNHVIGTCSSADKADFLHQLGCDRVINYKEEDLDTVLSKEYPKGIDIVYESVGGSMYETCLKHLAIRGRLIIIGMISSYKNQDAWSSNTSKFASPMYLLQKSASVRGFFLNHYLEHAPRHMQQLVNQVTSKELQSVVDEKAFVGLEQIPDAIDYLYSGKNQGKVVVALQTNASL